MRSVSRRVTPWNFIGGISGVVFSRLEVQVSFKATRKNPPGVLWKVRKPHRYKTSDERSLSWSPEVCQVKEAAVIREERALCKGKSLQWETEGSSKWFPAPVVFRRDLSRAVQASWPGKGVSSEVRRLGGDSKLWKNTKGQGQPWKKLRKAL